MTLRQQAGIHGNDSASPVDPLHCFRSRTRTGLIRIVLLKLVLRNLSSRSTISVALCTYNGAEYLPEQLRSIAEQTRLPDEVVICDDNSSDNTIGILQRFAARAPFFVRVSQNSLTLGAAQNFEKAIGLCEGNLIALSDQDDSWCANRLKETEDAMERNPDAGGVFANAKIVDSRLTPLGRSLWKTVRFNRKLRRQVDTGNAFEALLHYNFVTGATFAFRSQYRALITPIPKQWVHDGWIALLISAVSPITCIDRSIILYREHSNQQIGALRKPAIEELMDARVRGNRERYRHKVQQLEQVYVRLTNQRAFQAQRRAQELIFEKLQHLRMRAELPQERASRIPHIVDGWATGRYQRFGYGWRSAVRDLVVNLET